MARIVLKAVSGLLILFIVPLAVVLVAAARLYAIIEDARVDLGDRGAC